MACSGGMRYAEMAYRQPLPCGLWLVTKGFINGLIDYHIFCDEGIFTKFSIHDNS